jgi:hypothetical protein
MDTILNAHYEAVFSGTPEEVRAYLLEYPPGPADLVKLSDGTIVYATQYLAPEPA